jgi:hypothetical protein
VPGIEEEDAEEGYFRMNAQTQASAKRDKIAARFDSCVSVASFATAIGNNILNRVTVDG